MIEKDLYGFTSISFSKGRCKSGKICSKCKKYKPLWAFSKDNSTKDKLRYTCKTCDAKQQRLIRKNMKYKNPPKYKQCSDCGRIKPINDFGLDKTKKDKHRSYCLECMSLRSKRYKKPKTGFRKNKII